MKEGGEELAHFTARLRRAMTDADLGPDGVDRLLALPSGSWRRMLEGLPCPAFDRDQERRARLSVELVGLLGARMAGVGGMRRWLTSGGGASGEPTPLEWAAADVAHLSALVACARGLAG